MSSSATVDCVHSVPLLDRHATTHEQAMSPPVTFASPAAYMLPPAVVASLTDPPVKALNEPDVVEKLDKAGEQVVGGSPDDLARKVQEDYRRWGAFVKELPSLKVE